MMKAAPGGRSRACRGENGCSGASAGSKTRPRTPQRDPAPSYGRDSREPGDWALFGGPPGLGEGPHERGMPGAASHLLECTGRAPGLLPLLPATHAKAVSWRRARDANLREGRGGRAACSYPLPCPRVGGRQAEAVTPEKHRLPATGAPAASCRTAQLSSPSSTRRANPALGWPLPESQSTPSSFALTIRRDPAVGIVPGRALTEPSAPRGEPPAWPHVPFPGWGNFDRPPSPLPSPSSMISNLEKKN